MSHSRQEFPDFALFNGRYSVSAKGILKFNGLGKRDLEELNRQYEPDALVKDIVIDKLKGGEKPSEN